MFDRPWVRLVLGALAAALLGAMAARVAVSAVSGDRGAAGVADARGGGPGREGGASSGPAAGGSGAGGAAVGGSSGSGGGPTATLAGGSGRVTVHVTGEVRRPGVYALDEGARVNDAVRRAGGATADGDRQALNLAAALRDGQQVRVPPRPAATAGGGAAGGAAAGGAGPGGAGPIDLNTASLEELQTLDGVGEATAAKILKLREERGGLSGVDDLDEVPGIGAKKLEALRAQLEP